MIPTLLFTRRRPSPPSKLSALQPLALLTALWFALLLGAGPLHGQVLHDVHLPNTDHELNVYRIYGEEPGPTIMIIGGIQGDEPGSYLTADLYADIHLKKGNLIVVPRANLYSILLNQREGLTGDMNRKFDTVEKRNLEEEVVIILKDLISQSDCLLNLHEGSGFYSPTWVDDNENADRYGQSIIFDAETFTVPEKNKTIELGALARRVCDKANGQIDKPRFHFRPNNHDTLAPDSSHPEQRKSATYYALTKAHIPAFGVETSKSIRDLATKIRLHKLVINSFMEEFGILLDTPGIFLVKPKLDYLLLKVNDGMPMALHHDAEITLQPGDEITITDIIANYERGLIADVQGLGTANDIKQPFRIAKPTRIVVKKDAELCGWVILNINAAAGPSQATAAAAAPPAPAPAPAPLVASTTEPSPPAPAAAPEPASATPQDPLRARQFLVNVDGTLRTIEAGSTLALPASSRVILTGVRTSNALLDNDIVVNFKGFAPPKATNDGNDLNFPIYLGTNLLARHSLERDGKRYPVIALHDDTEIGQFLVEVTGN